MFLTKDCDISVNVRSYRKLTSTLPNNPGSTSHLKVIPTQSTVLSQFNNLITMDNLISSKHEKSASHLSIITTQSWFSQMILIDLTTHLKILSTQSIDRDLTSHLKVISTRLRQIFISSIDHLQLIFYHQWCIFMLSNQS